jgi:hypothetical protein
VEVPGGNHGNTTQSPEVAADASMKETDKSSNNTEESAARGSSGCRGGRRKGRPSRYTPVDHDDDGSVDSTDRWSRDNSLVINSGLQGDESLLIEQDDSLVINSRKRRGRPPKKISLMSQEREMMVESNDDESLLIEQDDSLVINSGKRRGRPPKKDRKRIAEEMDESWDVESLEQDSSLVINSGKRRGRPRKIDRKKDEEDEMDESCNMDDLEHDSSLTVLSERNQRRFQTDCVSDLNVSLLPDQCSVRSAPLTPIANLSGASKRKPGRPRKIQPTAGPAQITVAVDVHANGTWESNTPPGHGQGVGKGHTCDEPKLNIHHTYGLPGRLYF